MIEKSLDQKLRKIKADPSCKEFIIADAKDADMALGIGAPGRSPEAHASEVRFRTLREYRDIIRAIVEQRLVDIMLMSASTNEVLTLHERIFDNSPVTPAARANDTTDIFVVRGGKYVQDPARPFRSTTLDHIQCGKLECAPNERHLGANLGLYSVTFTNSTVLDLETLEAFKEFRLEAERKDFRYFLEVFDPNVAGVDPKHNAGFINDMIARALAGVVGKGRPQFLKMVYHGPQAMEELFRYDPSLVIGILGGSAGTTYDAFKLIAEAQKYGAKVALFGRKINNAENQFAFIRFLRLIVDGAISPEEAVRAYHAVLARLNVRPTRPLEEDMQLQTGVMSYGGSGATVSIPGVSPNGQASAVAPTAPAKSTEPAHACGCGGPKPGEACACDAAPDVKPSTTASAEPAKLAADERLTYHRQRIASVLGERPAQALAPTPIATAHVRPSAERGGEIPNFAAMTSSERLAYHRQRIRRLLGESG